MGSKVSKISIILIVIIAAIAILLSFFSYQYFTFASQEILNIASQEIRYRMLKFKHMIFQKYWKIVYNP